MAPLRREELWDQGQDETVEVNQRALIDSMYIDHRTISLSLLICAFRNPSKILGRTYKYVRLS